MQKHSTAITLVLSLLISGCSNHTGVQSKPFSLESIAKSDIDMVAEIHLEMTLEHLQELADKLYRRNPAEWKKTSTLSREHAVQRIFSKIDRTHNQTGAYAIRTIKQAFEPGYRGDRVRAFIGGLANMTLAAYNGQRKFFILDELDAQKLYNCARNYEVAAWLLRSRLDSNNNPILLSNEIGAVHNLSFERLFGQMIGEQDAIARVIANKTNRRIKNVIQTLVFLPV